MVTSGETNAQPSAGTTGQKIDKPTNTPGNKEPDTPPIPKDLGGGTTYYVSASAGNDSNDGKSAAKPFKTTAPVNALSLKAGDNILFKRGDTFTGRAT